jgi:hypothetical protein
LCACAFFLFYMVCASGAFFFLFLEGHRPPKPPTNGFLLRALPPANSAEALLRGCD